jgi:hypothetical protein
MIEVTLGGKPRKISFGLQVLGKIQKDLGINIVELGVEIDNANLFMILPVIIYRGNEKELLKEGKLIDYDLDTVDEWIQENGIYTKELIAVWKEFSASVMSYLPKTETKEKPTSKKK